MSVGVCIINRNGIVLAADSAGTCTVGENKMFYNSMNKVFNLSKNNKLGAITYGKTVIHDAPIEIILNKFKDYIDDEKILIENVFDIINLLEIFLNNYYEYFQFSKSEKENCLNLIFSLVSEWGKKINESIKDADVNNFENNINLVLNDFKNYIESCEHIKNYDISKYIICEYKNNIVSYIKDICPIIINYDNCLNEFINDIAIYFNLSLILEIQQPLGLLIAGYDSKSAFPKYVHVSIYNYLGKKLKYNVIELFDESGNCSSITPLAQPDIINTFCKGISDDYLRTIPNILKTEIDKRINNLATNKEEVIKAFEGINASINEVIIEKSRNEYINPLISSLQVLQISDMALLAENLVNITALKRKFSMDGNQQTVGGPTDVASISLGEGFTWIKRKKYQNID